MSKEKQYLISNALMNEIRNSPTVEEGEVEKALEFYRDKEYIEDTLKSMLEEFMSLMPKTKVWNYEFYTDKDGLYCRRSIHEQGLLAVNSLPVHYPAAKREKLTNILWGVLNMYARISDE